MTQNNLQKHLDNSLYGSPKIKPEEQKKYLGTFRERCYVALTVTQMRNKQNQINFSKELQAHPQGLVLLNGAIELPLQTSYIQKAREHGHQFTIIADDSKVTPETIGLVFAAKEPVNETEIDIEKKYPQPEKERTQPSSRKKFFQNFFS